jgi:hypothetical protein
MTAHEANRILCKALGDHSQKLWTDADDWQKESARKGVIKLTQDPDMTPRKIHESWMKDKVEDGWVYGPVKDPDEKEHPCMVPYDSLPPEQKLKDDLYLLIVRSMLALV